jgi:hypothetical protein
VINQPRDSLAGANGARSLPLSISLSEPYVLNQGSKRKAARTLSIDDEIQEAD